MSVKEELKALMLQSGVGADFDGDGVQIYDVSTENDIKFYTLDELFTKYEEAGLNNGGQYDYNDPGEFTGHGQVEFEPYQSAEEWLDDVTTTDIELFALKLHLNQL